MPKKLTLAALVLAGAPAQAQLAPGPYVFADDIAVALRTAPDHNQQAAWQYSQIGHYQAALEAWGKS